MARIKVHELGERLKLRDFKAELALLCVVFCSGEFFISGIKLTSKFLTVIDSARRLG